MAADTITITKDEYDRQVRAVTMQMQATLDTTGYDSFADAMDKLGLWDFVYHQAEVLAYAYADNRRLQNVIHTRNVYG